jgi:voltage-gated potassium channel
LAVPESLVLSTPAIAPLKRRDMWKTRWLYTRAILIEFRWTIGVLTLSMLIAAVLIWITPVEGKRVDIGISIYAAWMALLAQQVFTPPPRWYLAVINAVYPIFGLILIGEGIVRLALLIISKRQGEKEWTRVMASTYRDHIVLCGVGNLGFRILEQLVARQLEVVAIEKNEQSRFIAQARAWNVPVLVRDMKDDQALLESGVPHARAVIICTNDDMANLETALDARRLNPPVRIVMRLFEQDIARKISGALTIDAVFSASALAAPIIAAMTLGTRIISSDVIGGVSYMTGEVPVQEGSALAGKRIDELEKSHDGTRVLAVLQSGQNGALIPASDHTISPGQTLVVHTPAQRLAAIAEAGRKP